MSNNIPQSSNHPSPQFNLMIKYLEMGAQPPWQITSSNPRSCTVMKRRATNAAPRTLMTLKDMCAPQTVNLFTISYELLRNEKRPWNKT